MYGIVAHFLNRNRGGRGRTQGARPRSRSMSPRSKSPRNRSPRRDLCKYSLRRCNYEPIIWRIYKIFGKKITKGRHQNYIVKIDEDGGKNVYLYKRISLFPLKRGNLAVNIDWGRGSRRLSLQYKGREFP